MAPWLWFVLVGRGEEEDEAHGGGDGICSFQPDLIWKRALILHFSSWGGCSVAQDLAQSCFQTPAMGGFCMPFALVMFG